MLHIKYQESKHISSLLKQDSSIDTLSSVTPAHFKYLHDIKKRYFPTTEINMIKTIECSSLFHLTWINTTGFIE